jgi:hypothetical protein
LIKINAYTCFQILAASNKYPFAKVFLAIKPIIAAYIALMSAWFFAYDDLLPKKQTYGLVQKRQERD